MRRSWPWLLTAVLVAVLVAVAATRSYAVLASSSMAPWASPGSLLVHEVVPAEQVGVGDVVTVPVPGGRLVTHRVVEVVDGDGTRAVRLRGDASPLPDPVPVELPTDVARVQLVVPLLGAALTTGAPLLWAGGALLLGGLVGLLVTRHRAREANGPRGASRPGAAWVPASSPLGPEGLEEQDSVRIVRPSAPDVRIEALLATCEQFAEDGMPRPVLRDLVRVRSAEVLGLPPAEQAGPVRALDDAGRFYVVALADADPAALSMVPVHSTRRRGATAALDAWWDQVAERVPTPASAALAPWVR